ncbi:MAG TPA: GNAT family N-acetyltransferase [Chloroflexi bacterium]|jgi:ribosomal protein S18 acetylase RimI-like enzyme|nr:GNAT family N-acetyltransferase [Chloroflexota bacterium]
MRTNHRRYSEEAGDFARLGRFFIRHNDHIRAHSTWCIGRIADWKHGLYGNKMDIGDFTGHNARLWFDAFDELVGFVVSENGDAGITIITLPGYRFLFEEMLCWAMTNWGDREPRMAIEITDRQDVEAAVLTRYGFSCDSTFYTRCFDLTREPGVHFPLEEGFSIVDMQAHPDYRAQLILRREAFGGVSDMGEDEIARGLRLAEYGRQSPIYYPRTDLCVMASDGRFVSCCEALIDAHNLTADIERICTHSAFRRRGFARAVIQECLRRLHHMGIHTAYITGYSPEAIALYGSMGAVGELKAYVYKTAEK